ncbi:MAG: amidinotransferase [Clostridiales bacterium]|nr:MAG: amidinotransferase [Clostridiales bacterium]
MRQSTNEVIMIRPVGFKFNVQTALNNIYQKNDDRSLESIQEDALKEFDNLVEKLRSKGIKVNVLDDTSKPETPDSIFPNNWFSTHRDRFTIIYPMFAENRQQEVGKFIDKVVEISENKSKKEKIIDYRDYIAKKIHLEGTGSLVLDRENKIAYCTLSPRSDLELFNKFCEDTGYEGVSFRSYQDNIPVYHTNVVVSVGKENIIVCLEAITDLDERQMVKEKMLSSGKNIIEITLEQVKNYVGNALELVCENGEVIIAMSKTAYDALTREQREKIERSTEIVYSDIRTIEFYGGGSLRCMIAEVF